MIKKNKIKLILSSLVTISPIALGLILWNKLPDVMTSHWGADGKADSLMLKSVFVFLVPFIFLLLHWVCIFVTFYVDKSNRNQTAKATTLVIWLMPIMSLFVNTMAYSASLGSEFNVSSLTFAILGFAFIAIGNYLPKCKQNNSLGIKLPWTFASEENWNATHRFGGKVWVICGIVMIFLTVLPTKFVVILLLPLIFAATLIPTVYSAWHYKKEVENGTSLPLKQVKSLYKPHFIVGTVITVVLLLLLFIPMFCGDIDIIYNENNFTLEAFMWSDTVVEYEEIDNITLRYDVEVGLRTHGLGSPKLLAGNFENDEFGAYTRYSYSKCESCVLLESEGRYLAISGETDEDTKEIYDELIKRIK